MADRFPRDIDLIERSLYEHADDIKHHAAQAADDDYVYAILTHDGQWRSITHGSPNNSIQYDPAVEVLVTFTRPRQIDTDDATRDAIARWVAQARAVRDKLDQDEARGDL